MEGLLLKTTRKLVLSRKKLSMKKNSSEAQINEVKITEVEVDEVKISKVKVTGKQSKLRQALNRGRASDFF